MLNIHRTVCLLATFGGHTFRPLLATAVIHTSASTTSNGGRVSSDDMIIQRVIIIHRHGDRSQISRSAGPAYPECDEVTKAWHGLMPTESTLKLLQNTAKKKLLSKTRWIDDDNSVYSGRDKSEYPYGMLTELGIQQMVQVGRELRKRYKHLLQSTQNDNSVGQSLYCRSTNVCRTILSLRGLLVGLLYSDNHDLANHAEESMVTIESRDKSTETLYPDCNEVPCKAMHARRKQLYADQYIEINFPGYFDLETKFKSLLGYTDRVNWLGAREVLFSQRTHNIQITPGVTDEDIHRISALSGFIWSRLFNDKYLNRLSIGRFVSEMVYDLEASLHENSSTKLLIYSGHDSTLVPLMCALEIYDDSWPEYAAYLTIEVACRKDEKSNLFVRSAYNGKYLPMFLSNESWCPFNHFIEKLGNVAIDPGQYFKECNQSIDISSVGDNF